jgi:ABC-type transporter Mla maintaining outer membrane lipid asymmetry permease subunit MlaE
VGRGEAAGGRLGAAVEAVGEGAALLGRSLSEARRVRSIGREVLRQAALVAVGTLLALGAVSLLAGAACGVEAVAISRQLGARGAVGGLSVFCSLREVLPLVVGYVIALGVGCRLVGDLAESDEEPARRAAPRVLGVLVTFPLAYLLALAGTSIGALGVGIGRFGEASQGAFIGLFLAFHDDTDLALAFAKSLIMTLFVLGAGLLFGARAHREGEGAGTATARFATVAVVGVTVIAAVATLVLWAANPRIPAG